MARRVAGLAPGQITTGLAVGSAAACIADGVALTFTSAYGAVSLVPVAAWLVGLGLLMAVALDHRGRG